MKKFLVTLLAITMLISTTACGKQTPDQSFNQSEGQSSSQSTDKSSDQSKEQSADQLEKEESHKTITLEADNEYMIISALDTSECTWEDGYYSGSISYIATTTQKYIDEYSDYGYRQIFFGFYNENGDLVGDDYTQDNCVYDREYTMEGSAYVMISSKHNISEVKVLKIVCQT